MKKDMLFSGHDDDVELSDNRDGEYNEWRANKTQEEIDAELSGDFSMYFGEEQN